MQKEISISTLKPGMFVTKLDLPWFKHPFITARRGLITAEFEIEELRKLGVSKLTIDTDKGTFFDPQLADYEPEEAGAAPVMIRQDNRKSVLPQSEGAKVPIEKEMRFAAKLYSETVEYAKNVIADVKAGRQINVKESHVLVDGLIESVFRNADAISTLTKLKSYDEYTYTHCINLAALGVIFGRHMHLPKEDLRLVGLAGMFHDIGKSRIPEEILNKPGKLTDAEFEIMKRHPQEGFNILKVQNDLAPEIARAALEHHERHDGLGYPRGIHGKQIGRLSALIGIVDVYDALTSERIYKPRIMPHVALRIMYQCRDKEFEALNVDNFIKCLGIYPVTSLVRLSSGELAVVLESNDERPLYPKIKVILNRKLMPVHPRVIDLSSGETPYLDGHKVEIADCVDPRTLRLDLSKYVY